MCVLTHCPHERCEDRNRGVVKPKAVPRAPEPMNTAATPVINTLSIGMDKEELMASRPRRASPVVRLLRVPMHRVQRYMMSHTGQFHFVTACCVGSCVWIIVTTFSRVPVGLITENGTLCPRVTVCAETWYALVLLFFSRSSARTTCARRSSARSSASGSPSTTSTTCTSSQARSSPLTSGCTASPTLYAGRRRRGHVRQPQPPLEERDGDERPHLAAPHAADRAAHEEREAAQAHAVRVAQGPALPLGRVVPLHPLPRAADAHRVDPRRAARRVCGGLLHRLLLAHLPHRDPHLLPPRHRGRGAAVRARVAPLCAGAARRRAA
eukprot:1715733-Prymnesium_polylepis.2